MTNTFAALTAAGIVYDPADFADPHLDGPTALTVTADGRVYGHLAKWESCHIGFPGQCVSPPSSDQGYKYFHQGVVATKAGDLPVGKITLGTGHAPLSGTDAVAAAAHYDDTGTVAATVRAGEDEHGIWLAGRLVPGLDDGKVEELRRSGVSGDWRGVDGNLELVAALAVNVPGFPVPRTEQLVAAGGGVALVAAGVVVDSMPETPAELAAVVAAAVDDRLRVQARRDAAAQRMTALTAAAVSDRRARATAEVERVQASIAATDVDALTAALDSGVPGHLPHALRKYWTKGAGVSRWAASPHPYTSLVRALRSELPAKAQHMVNGLAANLFKDVFGIYPRQREKLTAAGKLDRRVRTQEGATRYKVSIGDLIPEAVDDVKRTAGDFAEAAGNDVARALDPGRDKPKAPAKKKPTPTSGKVTEPEPTEDTTPDRGEEPSTPNITANDPVDDPEGAAEEARTEGDERPDVPDDAPAPRTEGEGRLEEDQLPESGARGGKLIDFADGIAYYDDGSYTDGVTWQIGDPDKESKALSASAVLARIFGGDVNPKG